MKKHIAISLLLIFSVLFSACGGAGYPGVSSSAAAAGEINSSGKSYYSDESTGYGAVQTIDGEIMYEEEVLPEAAADYAMDDSGSSGGVSVTGPSAQSGRKIITTVDLQMESIEYDRCVNQIYAAIEAAGGFVEYSDIAGEILSPEELEGKEAASPASGKGAVGVQNLSTSQKAAPSLVSAVEEYRYYTGDRYLYMRIRVPQTGLAVFLRQLEACGNVLSKQESAEDITLRYVDIEAHVKALRLEQDKLMEMLTQTESVEAMIQIQQRLSEIRYQLESYESQLRVMDDQVSFATVNLRLNEVVAYTPPPDTPALSVGERISLGFSSTLRSIGSWWVNAFVWLAVNSVYLVVVLIALAACVVWGRRYLKKQKKRREAAEKTAGSGNAEEGNEKKQNEQNE